MNKRNLDDLVIRQSEFKGEIGVAKADITPPDGIYSRSWGSAKHDAAEGIHRPLYVTSMFIRGGDVPPAPHVKGGLLGADYKIENGRYRFARIFNGENWNPDLRAPLTRPGTETAVFRSTRRPSATL